ncbi:hypothetical protein BDV33DRAFT_210601 [Aspergillus novoparasiticus]|uniref:Uncharacterized protein n=1 Tax=Aspergillus novoparasiticus TaxID=986946 RepID=A0A5N6E635_9EURO|nr:hypothetical protein BDV33DRAFT_210601 [Aspergillus novoparasiticus]
MKKSVAFASVWLASTGLSIPLGAGGTSHPLVATSDEQSGLNLLTGNTRVEFERLFGTGKVRAKDDPSLPPAADSSVKLPWYPLTNEQRSCYDGLSATKTIEQCLGTERYCQEELWGGYDNLKYGNTGSSAKTVEDTEREAPPDMVKLARNFDNHVKMNAKKLPPHLQQKYLDRFATVILRDSEGRFRIVFKDNATGEPLAGDKLTNWQKWTLEQVKGDNTDPGSRPSNQKQAATASTLSFPQATSSRWKEPDSSKCRDNKSGSEDCLGTQRYCELGASTMKDEAKREKVQKDCEASREPSASRE